MKSLPCAFASRRQAKLVLTCLLCLAAAFAVACARPAAQAPSPGPGPAAEQEKQDTAVDVQAAAGVVVDEPAAEGERLDPELTKEADEPVAAADLTPSQQEALQSEDEITFDLDVRETEVFLYYFNYFTATDKSGNPKSGRRAFVRWLDRAKPFLPYVREVIREKGLPEDIIFLPFAESGYNPWAYSHAGAAGMWQFMPYTGRLYGLEVDWWIDERRDPYKSTYAAVEYLTKLHGMFDDWYLALAAYNAGEGRVARAIKRCNTTDYFEISKHRYALHRETKRYVPKILAILKIVKNLEKLGFEPIDWSVDPNLAEVEVKGGTDLLALARESGISWEQFRKLNPQFRRNVSPPDMTCTVRVPAASHESALAYLDDPDARPFAGFKGYRVRNGDSWWRISRRYGVPISVLKDLNNRTSNLLRPGQYLVIPGSASSALAVNTPREETRSYAAKRANYVVCSGDTLWDIAKAHGVSLSTLKRANGLTSGRYLRVGQKLYIPNSGAAQARASHQEAGTVNRVLTYRVRKGDTVWSIAKRYNVSPDKVLSWNNLSRRSVIHPGQTLRIRLD